MGFEASALLSLDASAARSRPLHYWTTGQQGEVVELLVAMQAVWCADWGLPTPPKVPDGTADLTEDAARRALHAQWFGSGSAGGQLSAHPDNTPTMAESVTAEAWDNWRSRLDSALGTGATAYGLGLHAEVPARWTGILDLRLPWWQGALPLRLSRHAVSRLLQLDPTSPPILRPLPSPPGLASVSVALGGRLLEARALLSPVCLTLAQLEGLQLGDVIALDHPLDVPVGVQLRHPGGDTTPLCRAWLGQKKGQMALLTEHTGTD